MLMATHKSVMVFLNFDCKWSVNMINPLFASAGLGSMASAGAGGKINDSEKNTAIEKVRAKEEEVAKLNNKVKEYTKAGDLDAATQALKEYEDYVNKNFGPPPGEARAFKDEYAKLEKKPFDTPGQPQKSAIMYG